MSAGINHLHESICCSLEDRLMTPTGRISSFELAQKLLSLPDWTLDGRGLRAAYRFDSASTALQFIVQVGLRCEQDNWHPHLDWRVNTVALRLALHQCEQPGAQDLKLARHISIEASKLESQVTTGR